MLPSRALVASAEPFLDGSEGTHPARDLVLERQRGLVAEPDRRRVDRVQLRQHPRRRELARPDDVVRLGLGAGLQDRFEAVAADERHREERWLVRRVAGIVEEHGRHAHSVRPFERPQ